MPVVVVAGMHRSGTSLTASVLEQLDVDMGADLLPADRANVRGYYEDRVFLEFQRELLRHASPRDAQGWRDWGWTEREVLDHDTIAAAAPDARRLVEERSAALGDRPWGWKDPRTTLLLDLWDGILDDVHYVCVYRAPWEVLDSIVRVADGGFVRDPSWALRAWSFYNRRMLEFVAAHRDACTVVDVGALIADPTGGVALLVDRVGLSADDSRRRAAAAVIEPSLLRRAGDQDLVERLVRAAAPEHVDELAALDATADLVAPRTAPAALALDAADAREVLVRWRAAEAERDQLRTQLATLEAAYAELREESEARHARMLEKEREAIERLEAIHELRRELDARAN
ncbi:MAG TPA: sulfotransferase [Acidimicrobiia bacterium]|nr:sulfotransferase [Acidimicrobiia bacterium]